MEEFRVGGGALLGETARASRRFDSTSGPDRLDKLDYSRRHFQVHPTVAKPFQRREPNTDIGTREIWRKRVPVGCISNRGGERRNGHDQAWHTEVMSANLSTRVLS